MWQAIERKRENERVFDLRNVGAELTMGGRSVCIRGDTMTSIDTRSIFTQFN